MNDQIFNQEFWQSILEQFINWAVLKVPVLLLSIVLLIIALRLSGLVVRGLKKVILGRVVAGDVESEKRANTLLGIVRGILKIIIWSIFVLMFLRELGMDIAPILAGAGILGLAVGFGAQELVRDFISGFFILFDNQIRTGDVANINGQGGVVERIALRTVTLRDFSGVVHIFQNGKINTLSNLTKEWSAMAFDIGVAYKEDVDKVMGIMKRVGDKMMEDPEFKDKILEPIEVMGLDSFGDSAIIIKARFKTAPIEQWFIGRAYRRRLKIAFDAEKIEIPFPHRTIYWGEEIKPLPLEK